MIDDIGVIAGDYWLKKLRSRLKFIHDIDVELSTPLTKKELDLQSLMDGYIFENAIPRYINGRMSPEMKKAGIKMGYYASRESVSKGDPLELQGRKKRAKNYKDNVDKISITKAMEKRLPYAKDPYGALKDELHERSIISWEIECAVHIFMRNELHMLLMSSYECCDRMIYVVLQG